MLSSRPALIINSIFSGADVSAGSQSKIHLSSRVLRGVSYENKKNSCRRCLGVSHAMPVFMCTTATVSDDEMRMRNGDYSKAVDLMHPWADATEEGLKGLVQGLVDDNMMFEGEKTFSLCYDVRKHSGQAHGVAYTEKTYTCDYVVGELKYTIKFVLVNANKQVGIEKISIMLAKDE